MVISGSSDSGVFAYTSSSSPGNQEGRKVHAPMFMPEVATVLTQAKPPTTPHKVKTELSPGGSAIKPKTEDPGPSSQRHGIKPPDEHHETGKQVAKHRLPLSPPSPLITQLGPVHGVKLSPSDQAINLTIASDRPDTHHPVPCHPAAPCPPQHLVGDSSRTSTAALPIITQSAMSSQPSIPSSLTAQTLQPWYSWEGLRRRDYPAQSGVTDNLGGGQPGSIAPATSSTVTDVKQEGERPSESAAPFDLSLPVSATSRIASKEDSPTGETHGASHSSESNCPFFAPCVLIY